LFLGATTTVPARTIAIGDIHGCSLALKTLLEAIDPGPDDLLVPLGDYIDRGPDSRGVLDQIIALRVCCTVVPLLGNHEEMLLAALKDRTALRLWLSCGGVEAIASYSTRLRLPTHPDSLVSVIPEEHLFFLQTCQPYYQTDTHLFVHAGYLSERPLEEQPVEALRWQPLNAQASRQHCSGKVAIVGHTPQKTGEILDLGYLKCIDTFCHGGGWLTAMVVGTGQVWQANERGELRCRRSVAGSILFDWLFRLVAEGSDLCRKMTSLRNFAGWRWMRTPFTCGYSTVARSARR
jgi:serine/threonine protein phosphatase 1